MGRGRAKAKQTKVARKLKYQTLDTDLSALQRELSGDVDNGASENVDADLDDVEDDVEDYLDDEDDFSRS
jgi:hypothetical protein